MNNDATTVTRGAFRRRGAADYLDVSEDTIDRLIARGELKSALVGGARVIPVSELAAFLDRKVAEATFQRTKQPRC